MDIAMKKQGKQDKQGKVASSENSRGGGNVSVKELSKGRSDILKIDPNDLHIDPLFNVRDDGEEYQEHVLWLKASIEAEGVREPLRARNRGGKLTITNGHSRMKAIQMLLNEGVAIKTVPVILEDRYADEADITLTLITSNSGKKLTTLELGKVYRRLLQFGWTEEEIARRSAVTTQTITRALELHSAPTEIREMVKNGEVSATLAINTMRSSEDDEEATDILIQAKETATKQGKKKVTAKQVDPIKKSGSNSGSGSATKSKSDQQVKPASPKTAVRIVKDELLSAVVEEEDIFVSGTKRKAIVITMEPEAWQAIKDAIDFDA